MLNPETEKQIQEIAAEAEKTAAARYNQTAAHFQEALRSAAEAEAETQRAAEAWKARLLSLFIGDPDYIHNALTGADDPGPELTSADATAAAFTLGVTPLGFTAVNWYRQAAADFEAGRYPEALGMFIDAETAEQLRPGIEKAKTQYTKKRGHYMTLAQFLTREYNQKNFTEILTEHGYKAGDALDSPEAAAALDEYTEKVNSGEIEPEASIFEDLLYDISTPTINGEVSALYYQGMDKVSRNLTKLSGNGDIDALRVDKVSSRGKPRSQELSIYSSLNLQELKEEYPQLAPVLDKITPLDEKYYWAIATMWKKWEENGCPSGPYLEVTAGQIHRQAGFTCKINAHYLDNIDTAVTKFAARFTLNNREEARRYKRYYYEDYDGPLMHIDRAHRRKTKNGEIVNTVYRIYAKPILLDFSERRKQITAIPLDALTMPQGVNTTPRNLTIEQAIKDRIYDTPTGEKAAIRLERIYKATDARSNDSKKDIRALVKKFLLHYRVNKLIKKYDTSDPKVYYFWR